MPPDLLETAYVLYFIGCTLHISTACTLFLGNMQLCYFILDNQYHPYGCIWLITWQALLCESICDPVWQKGTYSPSNFDHNFKVWNFIIFCADMITIPLFVRPGHICQWFYLKSLATDLHNTIVYYD